ncbi:putative tyrosine-protein phosphatase OCA6 [Balamuthia mandrillaris]
MKDQKLIPPFRFSIVEEGVYRGAYPTKRNMRFLKRLKLRTLISLIKEESEEISRFCQEQHIRHIHHRVGRSKDEINTPPKLVTEILETLIDPRNLPVYIHGFDGANVTGVVVMCLRKLQNWNLSVTFTEFTRFTRGNSISSIESEFVETFKTEIKVPPVIPHWLWQGRRNVRHPSMRLRLLKDNNNNHNVAGGEAHQQPYNVDGGTIITTSTTITVTTTNESDPTDSNETAPSSSFMSSSAFEEEQLHQQRQQHQQRSPDLRVSWEGPSSSFQRPVEHETSLLSPPRSSSPMSPIPADTLRRDNNNTHDDDSSIDSSNNDSFQEEKEASGDGWVDVDISDAQWDDSRDLDALALELGPSGRWKRRSNIPW